MSKTDSIIKKLNGLKKDDIEQTLADYNTRFSQDDKAVSFLFNTIDNNTEEGILCKVIVLNDRYGTQLHSRERNNKDNNGNNEDKKETIHFQLMANIIFNRFGEVDNPEKARKWISDTIKHIETNHKNYKRPLSFLSKYCYWSFQNSDIPIMDSYAKGMLYYLSKTEPYKNEIHIKQSDLQDYSVYCEKYDKMVELLRKKFKKQYTYREIDMFLWYYGKYVLKDNNKIDVSL